MGSGSGRTSELALLASPKGRGTFPSSNSIMSASAIFNKSSEVAAVDNKIFVNNSNCPKDSLADERDCLYQLIMTPKQIQDSIPGNE